MPITLCIGIFLFNTSTIALSEQGISSYWKIGVGGVKIWEEKERLLKWEEVENVFSMSFTWLPYHVFGLIGEQDGSQIKFFFGSFTTHKKEALIYVADHVNQRVIDDEVQELAEKYRSQLQD